MGASRALTKGELRDRIWSRLDARGIGRFPFPLRDRIPNFAGADVAAERAAALPEWQHARRLKMNPDAAQRPLRLQALRDGKLVFMAVPRLRTARCFIKLDPRRLGSRIAQAATIGGAGALGELVGPDALGRIDLVVAGSVAVNRHGERVGKGGGYSDLEFAVARELGAVGDRTPVLTTVHELQVVPHRIPMTSHDVPLDLIVTPERVIRVRRARRKPRGLVWADLSAAQIEAMPVLAQLRPAAPRSPARHARPRRGRP